jgi:DHA1 family bicyclomycin/chloramphenicol resistance-like MFS transporter
MSSAPSPDAGAARPQAPSALFLLVLVAITAIGPMATQIFFPALPAIQAEFGIEAALAQLTVSLSMAAIAVATLAYGPLSDHFGRRPVMVAGLVIFIAGSVMSLFADDIGVLITARIIQAAGGTCGIVLSRAIIRDVYAEEKVAKVLAYTTVAMVVAPMVAPALGGLLTDYLGWRSTFVFIAAAGLLVLVGVGLHLDETVSAPPTHPGLSGMIQGFGLLLRSPRFNGFTFQSAFQLSVFFIFASAAPYVMVNILGRPAAEYGLYFMIVPLGFIAGNFVAARASEAVGLERMSMIGSIISVVGTAVGAALVFSGQWAPWAIFGPGMIFAFGGGLLMPNSQAGALSVHPRSAGTASGLSGFLQMGLAAVFAQLAGQLQDDTPYPMAMLMVAAAVFGLISLAIGLRLDSGRDRR